jgi:hypothetical protein
MCKKLFNILVILLAISAISSPAFAYDQTIFGPQVYEISEKGVLLFVQELDLDDHGKGTVIVSKNTPDMKIKDGIIRFDKKLKHHKKHSEKDHKVKKPKGKGAINLDKFLRSKKPVYEKKIKLKDANYLTVYLKGTPGASFSIEIRKKGVSPPPEVTFSADPQTILRGDSTTLTWAATNADDVSINQGVGSVPESGSQVILPQQTATYTITATGPGGAAATSVTITVIDPSDPPAVNFSASPASIAQGELSTLSWTSINAQNVHIDNGIGSVSLNGSTAVDPENTTKYTITVTGATGSASAQAVVMVTGNPDPPPEGSFGAQYQDLIPADATVDEYDPKRFSLITGLVKDINGSPIEYVAVTVHGHPEYGTVNTDAAGQFSIPVEGGAAMTLAYQKQGLITAHRQVYVPWSDTAIAETIQMISEDPVATTITFDGDSGTVITHQSTEVSDESGSRSTTMVFTGNNHAYLVDEEGNDVQELTTITTRATEFTTPETMPASARESSAAEPISW